MRARALWPSWRRFGRCPRTRLLAIAIHVGPADFIDLTEFPSREMLRFTESRSPAKGSAHVSIRGRVVAEAVRDRVLHRPNHDQGGLPCGSDEEAASFGRARRLGQNSISN